MIAPGSVPRPGVAREAVRAGLLFAFGAGLGLALLVLLFKGGLFSGIEILFYRGLAISAVVAMIVLLLVSAVAARSGWGGFRDGLAAAVLSLGLNISFLVVAPVTVDRSISVFMLGYMAAHPEGPMSAERMADVFVRQYVGDMRQIERRMAEQVTSGNIVRSGDGYVLSAQGRRFIATAKWIAWAFDTDPRFVEPAPVRPQP